VDFFTAAFIQTGLNNYIYCVFHCWRWFGIYSSFIILHAQTCMHYITTNGCGNLTATILF